MINAILYENEGELVSANKAHSFAPAKWYFFKNRVRQEYPSLDEAVEAVKAQKNDDFGFKKDGQPVTNVKLIRQLTESDYKTLI